MPETLPDSPSAYSKIVGQFIRFAVVGIVNTAINFVIVLLLSSLFGITKGEKIIWISMVGFIAATTNSYFMNKAWAFHDQSHGGAQKPTIFLAVSLVGLAINSGIVYFVTTHVNPILNLGPHIWEVVALVVATGISLIWNFIGYKLFVFKNS
ncbi:MAG TPA: GtrA family protein [Patescibacteria group bacterium]|nr:GtrA family protein [Patescibacteria group bacterium]